MYKLKTPPQCYIIHSATISKTSWHCLTRVMKLDTPTFRTPHRRETKGYNWDKNGRKLNSNTREIQQWVMNVDTLRESHKWDTFIPTLLFINCTPLRICRASLWCWMNLNLISPYGSRTLNVGDSIHVLLWLTSRHGRFWLRFDVVSAVWIDNSLSH